MVRLRSYLIEKPSMPQVVFTKILTTAVYTLALQSHYNSEDLAPDKGIA